MKLFLVAKPNPHIPLGRVVRWIDQGFELMNQEPTDQQGKFKLTGTNIIFQPEQLSDYITPLNLKNRFAYDDGKAWDKLRHPATSKPEIIH